MAIITKKTALLGLLIVAGALSVWKFVWKPMESKQSINETAPAEETVQLGVTPTPAPTSTTVELPTEKKMSPEQTVKSVRVQTHYNNPGGGDDVAFVLSVDAEGKITDAITEVLAVNPTSKMRQAAFAQAMPAALVGKDLKSLSNVDRIGGSSLTTKSFNESLEKLKAQL